MRLTTLARKIHITPSKLIEYLKKNNIAVNNGVNTILDEKTVAVVFDKFSPIPVYADISAEPQVTKEKPEVEAGMKGMSTPEPEVEIILSQIAEKPEIIVEAAKKLTVEEPVATKYAENEITTPKTGTIDDLELGLSEDIELIKAKKVKLEGIKVIGKIDIPEKVKKARTRDEESKTNPPTNELKIDAAKPAEKQKKKFSKHKSLKAEKNRQALTYEEKLKLAEREKLKLQKQKARKEKERKKKYYLKNIQPKTIGRPVKKRKKVIDEGPSTAPKAVVHKNPLRRFWDWLNGVYDQY